MTYATPDNMSHAHFHLIYDGPALTEHTMDVRDLAPALLALGQVFEEANDALNGDRARVALKVRASFQSGSFGIDLDVAQSLMTQARALFAGETATAAANLLALLGFVSAAPVGLLGFIRWVRGRRIRQIVVLDDKLVRVEIDNEAIEVERRVLELYRRFRLRKALEDVIAKPLARDGIDFFAVKAEKGDASFIEVRKDERYLFQAPPEEDEAIDDTEFVTNLQLVTVAFRDDNKWRFSDGASTFYADVMDDTFLNRVNLSETAFSKGDILKVRLHRRQWLSGETMKSEYRVLEVLDHRRAGMQLRLPISDPSQGP